MEGFFCPNKEIPYTHYLSSSLTREAHSSSEHESYRDSYKVQDLLGTV